MIPAESHRIDLWGQSKSINILSKLTLVNFGRFAPLMNNQGLFGILLFSEIVVLGLTGWWWFADKESSSNEHRRYL